MCGLSASAGNLLILFSPFGKNQPMRVICCAGKRLEITVSGQTPGNLIIINTVTSAVNGQLHVRVANITDEDVWLQPHTRIGVLYEINNISGY